MITCKHSSLKPLSQSRPGGVYFDGHNNWHSWPVWVLSHNAEARPSTSLIKTDGWGAFLLLTANLNTVYAASEENLSSRQRRCDKARQRLWPLCLGAQHHHQHQHQRFGLLVTRLTGPASAESRLRTDTHLAYTVLVQRWWISILEGRAARRGRL